MNVVHESKCPPLVQPPFSTTSLMTIVILISQITLANSQSHSNDSKNDYNTMPLPVPSCIFSLSAKHMKRTSLSLLHSRIHLATQFCFACRATFALFVWLYLPSSSWDKYCFDYFRYVTRSLCSSTSCRLLLSAKIIFLSPFGEN